MTKKVVGGIYRVKRSGTYHNWNGGILCILIDSENREHSALFYNADSHQKRMYLLMSDVEFVGMVD